MKNAILKSISATNFGPFNGTIEFDMETSVPKGQIIDNHTFVAGDNQQFNKIAYIYGANGSGKSNFCKIILQIQRAIMLSPIRASNNPQLLDMLPLKDELAVQRNYFKFDVSGKGRVTSYSIQVLIDDVLYTYSFSIAENNDVVSEKLMKKKRRTETILERTSPKFESITLKSELKSFHDNVHVVKDNALCLSMASFLNNKLATTIVATITDIQVVNMAAMRGLSNLSEETFSAEKKEEYLRILKSADPTLEDIQVEFNEKKVEKHSLDSDDLENRAVILKSVRVDVKSTHSIYDNHKAVSQSELPFLQIESNGTIKLLDILPTIFDALSTGNILIVDEIENGLHPTVVKKMIELFYNPETNPHNAQLICTTHNVLLINEAVQRDEVWLMDKNEYGESSMKHISDIPGLRSYDKLGQKMIEGAFGAMPNIISNSQ
ncbi:ATP/GTP-binding protein [uncultured Ruminococcus sp.]|jgi:AAA15 family ATPase/GTPase|uniref:AAA family ATPase n=1 Tax=uncultured Ruminococcus sp. TaxID=165186 RepID=UPI00266017CE|nr:ATP-binding protein [uncultured Ruminococcus sp.]